jgi:IclR helix-turn-helix domain
VTPLAHIGGIPVEEWLPFVVPVLAVYLYVRRRERRRRAEVKRLLAAGHMLDDELTARILERVRAARHLDVGVEHVALLYPPGPDGATATEIAARTRLGAAEVRRRLEDLIELGYLERGGSDDGEERVWLTSEGFAIEHIAEDVVLAAFAAEAERGSGHAPLQPTRTVRAPSGGDRVG